MNILLRKSLQPLVYLEMIPIIKTDHYMSLLHQHRCGTRPEEWERWSKILPSPSSQYPFCWVSGCLLPPLTDAQHGTGAARRQWDLPLPVPPSRLSTKTWGEGFIWHDGIWQHLDKKQGVHAVLNVGSKPFPSPAEAWERSTSLGMV